MHSSQFLTAVASPLLVFASIANAAYTITDNFNATNFFTSFSFFSGPDPTTGFVQYAPVATANSTGMAAIKNNAVYLGVDATTMNPAGGRASTRVTLNKAYTHGLFVADIAHMPGGICGVWPAFWLFGPGWPASGEIDIIEGVNAQTTNSITLHTSAGCLLASTGSLPSSILAGQDCNAGGGNTGCAMSTVNTQGYGAGFNAVGGGVYTMEWTSTAIKVWFFPRTAIPADITSGQPTPATWGVPVASFSGPGCAIDQHFMNHNIIFDTTFCGQWAGAVWTTGSCAALAPTCDAYVGANPAAFANAFWTINSVKVYSDPIAAAAKKGAAAAAAEAETPPVIAGAKTPAVVAGAKTPGAKTPAAKTPAASAETKKSAASAGTKKSAAASETKKPAAAAEAPMKGTRRHLLLSGNGRRAERDL